MKYNCEIRIAHPENPRSWSFIAHDDVDDYISMEFQSHPDYKKATPLSVCVSFFDDAWGDYAEEQRHLTLPQAKKMREFLDHFIKTEEVVNG